MASTYEYKVIEAGSGKKLTEMLAAEVAAGFEPMQLAGHTDGESGYWGVLLRRPRDD